MCGQSRSRAAAPSSVAPMPASSWEATRPPCYASGARSAARPSRRTSPATSSCSLGPPLRTSIAPGTSAIPAAASQTSSAASRTRRFRGWQQPSTALWTAPRLYSRPSSCCPGHSPRRRPPKSTWPSSSTTCGSPTCGARCFQSSLAVESGSRSRFRWTHFTSASWSRQRRSSGAASNPASRPT